MKTAELQFPRVARAIPFGPPNRIAPSLHGHTMTLVQALRMGAEAQRCCGKSAILFRPGSDVATLAPNQPSCDRVRTKGDT
jgi:hypothetical protein